MKYYVNAAATGDGSPGNPCGTISEAARLARPGDEVIVAPGIYREEVIPYHGGTDDSHRITYRSEIEGAAVISGAEVLEGWTEVEGGIWRTEIANDIFRGDNPFEDPVFGDWFYYDENRPVHRGTVYMNGMALYEAFSMAELNDGLPSPYSWDPDFSRNLFLAEVREKSTIIHVHLFHADPREQLMEFSARRHCFYPDREGVGYITLSGFTICMAAPQWAPPTAYQEGMIGPRWSKGWIIENCQVYGSRCVGISLGKYLQPENENKWLTKGRKHGTQNERDSICQAQNEGWSRETVGSHIIRRCDIHHCGQAGIAGHLGCIFSRIEDNHIHHINNMQDLNGAEIGGIKLHAAIDTEILRNRIHHCTRGLWLDWQAQGTRVSGNIFHHNQPPEGVTIRSQLSFGEDIFVEVSHGPTLIDNNLLLSLCSGRLSTQGIAFAHNLIAGSFTFVGSGTNNAGAACPESVRYTPYHVPHGTAVAGFMSILHGDARFFNNIFIQQEIPETLGNFIRESGRNRLSEMNIKTGLLPYADFPSQEDYDAMFTKERIAGDRSIYYRKLPVRAEGNVFVNGADPAGLDPAAELLSGQISLELLKTGEDWVLRTDLYLHLHAGNRQIITSDILGEAFEPEQRFENGDGSDLILDTDMRGQKRPENPMAGPLELKDVDSEEIKL